MHSAVEGTEAPEQRPPTRAQTLEGYLGLGSAGLMFVGLVLGRRLPDPGWAVVIILWALAWLFAISGVRRGLGGAQFAAWVTLVILVWHAGHMLVISWH